MAGKTVAASEYKKVAPMEINLAEPKEYLLADMMAASTAGSSVLLLAERKAVRSADCSAGSMVAK